MADCTVCDCSSVSCEFGLVSCPVRAGLAGGGWDKMDRRVLHSEHEWRVRVQKSDIESWESLARRSYRSPLSAQMKTLGSEGNGELACGLLVFFPSDGRVCVRSDV